MIVYEATKQLFVRKCQYLLRYNALCDKIQKERERETGMIEQ